VTVSPSARSAVGEFVGTWLIVVAVVGSGIAAQSLSDDAGLQLLINSFATAGALTAIIGAFANVCAARFNPLVTLLAVRDGLSLRTAAVEMLCQTAGAVGGVICAHIMFGWKVFEVGTKDRSAGRLIFAEMIASVGLLLIIMLTARRGTATHVAIGVAGYIAGAYFFTSSTSFANPAVTIGRMFTTSYAGIAPLSAVWFVVAQLVGLVVAGLLVEVLVEPDPNP
jgi:glycerol uptake facilitator-like aquaporin